ncbi:MAG TPA: DUF3822 family protein [Bacteroidales bacterium]|nr:DUF3822 family protein [Bacteroidales bacterium]HRZ49477.1 DUF3822 family protein [Bacteroidales bacterium]
MILPFPADEAFLHPGFTEFPHEGVEVAFSAGPSHFHYLVSEVAGGKILLSQQASGIRDGFYSLATFFRWLSNVSQRNIPLASVKGIVWKKEATLIPADLMTTDEDAEKWYSLTFGPVPEHHTLICPTHAISGNRVVFPFPLMEYNRLQSIASDILLTHPFSFRTPDPVNNTGQNPDPIIDLMPSDRQMFVRVWKSGTLVLHNTFPAETTEEIRYFLAGISRVAEAALKNHVFVYAGTDPDLMEKISRALTYFGATPSVVPLPPDKWPDAPAGFNRNLFADILQPVF